MSKELDPDQAGHFVQTVFMDYEQTPLTAKELKLNNIGLI